MAYEVIRRLGRGGMGVVDLAVDDDGHEVALKRLSLHGTPDELETARARIRREAEVLQGLDHPGIVRLREVVDDGDDLILVMDHLPGGNLAQRVAEDGPLSTEQVEQLADELLEALAAAHRQGVVHRDIKPSNVLFDAEGHAHLADFGAATNRDATVGLTRSEMVMGTPGFMSPEQARGEPATAASDVFSLGATLAFAATGHGPFGTADPRVLMLRAAAGRIDKLPRELAPPLRRRLLPMLDKVPARRPTAARARGGAAGTDARTAPRDAIDRRRRRAVAIGVLAGLACVALVIAVLADDGSRRGGAIGPRRTTTTRATTTTTEACRPLTYQPCGGRKAPGTDGKVCIDDRADYDGDRKNGCEAIPDRNRDGQRVVDGINGNLVPDGDVDRYVLPVNDHPQLFCDGAVHVSLTAPIGASQRLTVFRDGDKVGTTASSDGVPAEVTLGDPNCGSDDAGDLVAVITSIGSDRSPRDYELRVTGSY